MKKCCSCQELKPPSEYHRNKCHPDGLAARCKSCDRIYNKAYRIKRAVELSVMKKQYRHRLRSEGILRYGGKCSCCGESCVKFLTLEHCNGRQLGKRPTGYKAWAEVKRLGWPEGLFTVLCYNCNCAKGVHGICPHQEK